jgi:hypothetical protein
MEVKILFIFILISSYLLLLAKNKKIVTNSGKWLQKIIKIYEQDIKKAVTEK